MSIGVVTVAVGPKYQALLPGWAEAVAALETKPEVVTVAADELSDELIDRLDGILGEWQLILSRREWRHHPQVLVNDAIAFTPTEWICKMDVDDIILPHALNPVPTCSDADVVTFGIDVNGQGLIFTGVQADVILESEHNLVFSGSPFRRWLWIDNPFRDMIYEDWAFWIGCAKQQARFVSTNTVDYRYIVHEGQISQGVNAAYWTTIVRSLV